MLLRETRRKEHYSAYTMVSATLQNKQFSLMKALSTEEHQSVERCDVSLTGETTNTKHTHKRSEAQ
jgi:hypothetical protein